jgi:hypothetical protein
MHRVVKVVVAVAGILLLPSLASAQATIAGVVRDASAQFSPVSASRLRVPHLLKNPGRSLLTARDSIESPIFLQAATR